ncbi:MAG: hypothetical protein IT232_03505 [Flavobacteriales bacterium]|nr:hypothetical protein [Flavobacteriales bacterium]
MKRIILSFTVLIITTFAHANNDVELTLCSKSSSITIEELKTCKEVVLTNDKFTIFSYKIGYENKKAKYYIEFNCVSKEINAEFLEDLIRVAPDKIYIEQIIVVDADGNKLNLGYKIFKLVK